MCSMACRFAMGTPLSAGVWTNPIKIKNGPWNTPRPSGLGLPSLLGRCLSALARDRLCLEIVYQRLLDGLLFLLHLNLSWLGSRRLGEAELENTVVESRPGLIGVNLHGNRERSVEG